MGKFLDEEKMRQSIFKTSSRYFSEAARKKGEYRGHNYEFCLPAECANENLYIDIRIPIIKYFDNHNIKWHDGHRYQPANHLCS